MTNHSSTLQTIDFTEQTITSIYRKAFGNNCITFLSAAGAGLAQLTSVGIVSTYFDRHKDKLYSALVTTAFIGILIGPTLTEYLIHHLTTYKYALLIEASICSLILPASLIFKGPNNSTSTPPVSKETKNSNETGIEESSSVDPVEEKDSEIKILKKKIFSCQNTIQSHKLVLKDLVFLLVLAYFMMVSIGENTYFALEIDYVVSTRNLVSLEQAALGMSLTGIGTVIGSFSLALMSHWSFDRLAFSAVVTLFLGISLTLMPIVQSVYGVYGVNIGFGIADGLYVAGMASLIEYQFGQNEQFLVRFSYLLFVIGVGSLVGPIVAVNVGKAVGMSNSFYFLGGASILASIVLLLYWLVARFGGKASAWYVLWHAFLCSK